MAGIEVILRQALADFPGGAADDGVLVGIVMRIAVENGDPQSTLLQAIQAALESLLHHVPQKHRTPLAGMEMGAVQNSAKLSQHGLPGHVGPSGAKAKPFGITILVRLGHQCRAF